VGVLAGAVSGLCVLGAVVFRGAQTHPGTHKSNAGQLRRRGLVRRA
jgi:hypothetical protein